MNDKLKAILDDFSHDGKNYFQYLSSHHSSDEAVVRQKIILPVLTDFLGYDLQSDINPEDRIGKGFIDILIKVDDSPVFVIELKSTTETNLKEHLPQLSRYVRSKGVKYGMLTNGRIILIFDFYVNETIPVLSLNLQSLYTQQLFTDDSINVFYDLFSKQFFQDIRRLQKEIAETAALARPHILSHEQPQNDTILIDGLKVLIEKLKNTVKLRFLQYKAEDAAFKQEKEQKQCQLKTLKDRLIETVKRASNGMEGFTLPALDEALTDFEKHWVEYKSKEISLDKLINEIPQKLSLDREVKLKKIIDEIIRIYTGVLLTHTSDAENRKVLKAVKNKEKLIIALEEFLISEQSARKRQLEQTLLLLKKDWGQVGITEFNETLKGIKTGVKVDLNTPEVIGNVRQYGNEFTKYQEWVSKEEIRLRPVHQLLQSYEFWRHQLGVIGSEDKEDEFCLQTLYIFIIRILLVRIFEDKGLISQKISDGGYKTTEEFLSKLMVYINDVHHIILDLAYQDARQIYGHFFEHDIFDWYKWDSESIVRVFHYLNRFDFKNVGSDLIGKIYEQYVDIAERRNKGQFYTPQWAVNYILDIVGYKGQEIIGKRLLDPACGSGRFLVEAARRLVSELKGFNLTANELINERLCNSLFGLDINRFACFLAEVNILIQILDLVPKPTTKKAFTINRFQIYPTNTLIPVDTADYRFASAFEVDHAMAEIIKTKGQSPALGYDFTEGFDFVVGNPPYVKANRPGVDGMREDIKETGVYETLHKRWDLYIPFIEFGVKSLADGGKFSFIVPDSYPTVDYAEPSRHILLRDYTIETLTFIPHIKLFEGADVYNFIFSISKRPLPQRHLVKRFKTLEVISGVAETGDEITRYKTVELKPLAQRKWGEMVFRMEFEGKEGFDDVVELEELCYVSRGAELQANEKLYAGEFVKDDLIASFRTVKNMKPYIEGKDIERYGISKIRWLEWNTDRVPYKVRRPTFPELYENTKIIVGKSSGAIYDEDKLFSDQSGVIIIPYFQLESAIQKAIDIREGRIESEFSYGNLLSDEAKPKIEAGAGKELNLKYLLALINSGPLRQYFVKQIATGDTRSITPDDWRRFPVKLIPEKEQGHFAKLVDEITALKYETAKDLSINQLLKERHIPTIDLIDASSFVKNNINDDFSLSTCILDGNRLIVRKSPLYYIESKHQSVLKYLYIFISENMTELKNFTPSDFIRNVRLPKTSEKVDKFLRLLETEKRLLELKKLRPQEIDMEIDERVVRLYELQTEGRLYAVEGIPETAQHVFIKGSKAVGDINKQCFKLDGKWITRSSTKIPQLATIWWCINDKEYEGDKFISLLS
jgi:hypothetical protein